MDDVLEEQRAKRREQIKKAIPKELDQRQDSLTEQVHSLHQAAVRLGLYDAADWLDWTWRNG